MYLNSKFTWRITLLVCLILMLGACSTNTSQVNNSSEDEAENDNIEDTTTVEEDHALAFPVTIEHLKGEMTFDKVPQNIVVLDVQYADQMLALDKLPAGSVVAETDQGLPPYLGDKMDNIPLLGTYVEPNLEGILSVEPDLIIATEFHDEIQDELMKIAPTLTLERNEDWQTVLLKFGQILDEEEAAQNIINDYQQKVDDLKNELAEKVSDQTVALIRPRDKMIRLQSTSHRTSQILYDDLGLTPPEMAVNDTDSSMMISIEVLPEVDADHFFLLQDDTNIDLTAEFQETSIWKNLHAVTDNQVYVENTAQWIGYYGPIAIDLVIDQIADALN